MVAKGMVIATLPKKLPSVDLFVMFFEVPFELALEEFEELVVEFVVPLVKVPFMIAVPLVVDVLFEVKFPLASTQ